MNWINDSLGFKKYRSTFSPSLICKHIQNLGCQELEFHNLRLKTSLTVLCILDQLFHFDILIAFRKCRDGVQY